MTELRMYTIYDHPRDHPEHFVLRGWTITLRGPVPDYDVLVFDTADQAREAVPCGLANIGRADVDDPTIMETWL